MKSRRALVVEHEEKSRQIVDEVLAVLGHKYDAVGSILEAQEALAANEYSYILLNSDAPNRPGAEPRRQNAENFLDLLAKLKGEGRPPVIIMYSSVPGLDEDDLVCWVNDMTLRGAARFVRKPFKKAGRTLDRMIKKVLAGRQAVIDMDKGNVLVRPVAAEPGQDVAMSVKPISPASMSASLDTDIAPSGTLTRVQLNVLEAVAKSPHQTMLQADIIEAGGYGKHATRQCVNELLRVGLICRQREKGKAPRLPLKAGRFWQGLPEIVGGLQSLYQSHCLRPEKRCVVYTIRGEM